MENGKMIKGMEKSKRQIRMKKFSSKAIGLMMYFKNENLIWRFLLKIKKCFSAHFILKKAFLFLIFNLLLP